jgi:hypothetical protein
LDAQRPEGAMTASDKKTGGHLLDAQRPEGAMTASNKMTGSKGYFRFPLDPKIPLRDLPAHLPPPPRIPEDSMNIRFPDYYLNYPHNNGFWGDRITLGRHRDGRLDIAAAGQSGETPETLVSFPLAETFIKPPFSAAYWDVAGDRLVACVGNELYSMDLAAPGSKPVAIFTGSWAEPTSIPNLHPSGERVLVHGRRADRSTEALELDARTGAVLRRWTYAWWANHFHYVPADPSWIAYCHEGPTETVPDRVWVMHERHEPAGRSVFDQVSEKPGVFLCVGHERWAHHEVMGVVPAYGVSPAGPRGLYAVYADGRPARLISPGDRDWHADISRDGKTALVDTTGPHDVAGFGWEKANGVSDILLVEMASGKRRHLARTGYGPRHPWHPHPVFSPDGGMCWFNDFSGGAGRAAGISTGI